ncbi:hypothetical protein ABOB21_24930, partial [Escherichia coli]
MLEKSLATLFALLILAMLINRFLVWRLPERKGDEVTLRIRTWWGIVICFSLVISGPRWVLMNPLMILVKIIKLRWIHILSYDQMVSRKINNQTTRCANSIF